MSLPEGHEIHILSVFDQLRRTLSLEAGDVIDLLLRHHGPPTVEVPGALDLLPLIRADICSLTTKVHTMSETQDTLAAEVATLKTNMALLHTGVADIQTRLTSALAAAANAGADPAALSDLHGINTDLASVVAALAPAPPADPVPIAA